MHETLAAFWRRCEAATGLSAGVIPRRSGAAAKYAVLGGTILARRGATCLVTVGYPDREDPDGTPVWDARPTNFALATLGAAGAAARKP